MKYLKILILTILIFLSIFLESLNLNSSIDFILFPLGIVYFLQIYQNRNIAVLILGFVSLIFGVLTLEGIAILAVVYLLTFSLTSFVSKFIRLDFSRFVIFSILLVLIFNIFRFGLNIAKLDILSIGLNIVALILLLFVLKKIFKINKNDFK